MSRPAAALVALLAPLALPDAVSGDEASVVKLANGDELNAVVLEEHDDRVVVEHAVLGRMELARAQLAPEEPPDDGAFGSGLLRDWERSFELGVTGSEGNTEDMNVRAGLALSYEDEMKRWRFGANYLRGSQDGETDEHEAHALLERDWRFRNSPWFWFGRGFFDWDRFEDWDYRAGLFTGPGYEFYDTDTFKLRGAVGAGVTREFGSGEGITPEAVLGVDTEWHPGDRQKITAYNRVFPALDDLGEARNLSGVDYTVDVGDPDGVKLKIGLENEYDSDTGDDARQNDLKYYGSVLLGF